MLQNPIAREQGWHGMGRGKYAHGDRRPTIHDVQLVDNTEIAR